MTKGLRLTEERGLVVQVWEIVMRVEGGSEGPHVTSTTRGRVVGLTRPVAEPGPVVRPLVESVWLRTVGPYFCPGPSSSDPGVPCSRGRHLI